MTAVIGQIISAEDIAELNSAVPAILPPDVQTKVRALEPLTPQQQVEQVTEMLVHARAGLLVAVAAQDLPSIVQYKAQAAAIHEVAKQVRIGKDMQLEAAEFVRRAERGLGVAIREGQERGEIETPAEGKSRGARVRDDVVTYDKVKPKPTDFADKHELTNTHGGIYDLTDGVSDEQFEKVLSEAKEEGNLSRANVARKAKAKARQSDPEPVVVEPESVALPDDTEGIDAPASTRPERLTKHSSTEMLSNINGMLKGVVESLQFINPAEVDATANKQVVRDIRQSIGSIRKLLKEIENG